MNQYQPWGLLAGRILLAYIFLLSGYGKITSFAGTAGYMAAKMGLAQDSMLINAMLAATILIELGGGLLILLGWQARWAATAIFLFLIPVTAVFHPVWADAAEFNSFFKNLAIMGGLLYIAAFGPGAYSLGKDKC